MKINKKFFEVIALCWGIAFHKHKFLVHCTILDEMCYFVRQKVKVGSRSGVCLHLRTLIVCYVYFVLQNKCHGLTCPFGKYPRYGSCEKKFSSFEGACLCVKLFLEIQLGYDKDMQEMNYSAFSDHLDDTTQDIVNDMWELVNRGNARCDIERAVSRNRNIDGTGPTFNVSFSMALGSRCNLYNLTETVIDLTEETTIDHLNKTRKDISPNFDGCNFFLFSVWLD